jgi:N-succinyldiaminopimelate aminotransferase
LLQRALHRKQNAMNPIYAASKPTIFATMSSKAQAKGAINLGQGFPDDGAPQDVIDAAAAALRTGSNQYPPMAGVPELRAAIAAHYAVHQALDLVPEEVIVTSGATEALAAAILAIVSPGDEVVMFQPLYDAYKPLVERAGGIARVVRLEPPHWRITVTALEAVGSTRTRAVIVNTPLNPSGAMLTADERTMLADFCIAHNAIAICDEVWEHLVFDGAAHVSLMTEPGMRARTVKIGSAGKIFALTGWKVGWMCAAPPIADVLAKAHQFLTFTTPPNLQAGVAYGLGKHRGYFDDMRAHNERSRDRLVGGLTARGYAVLPCPATWFVTVDLTASGIALDDVAWCNWAVDTIGVAAIPVSAFYDSNPVTNIVRLCHAKADTTLDTALARLARRP